MILIGALPKVVGALAAIAGIATFVWTASAEYQKANEAEKREWAKAVVQQELLEKESASFDELFAAYQSAAIAKPNFGSLDLSKESFRRVIVELQESGPLHLNLTNEFFFNRYDQQQLENQTNENREMLDQVSDILKETLDRQREDEKNDYQDPTIRSWIFRIIYGNTKNLSVDDVAAKVSQITAVEIPAVKSQIQLLVEAGLLIIGRSGNIGFPCDSAQPDDKCISEGN